MNTRIDKTMIFDRNSNEKAPPRTPETRDGIVEENAGKLYNQFLDFGKILKERNDARLGGDSDIVNYFNGLMKLWRQSI